MDRLVQDLATTWASIVELCTPLTEDEWKRPTGCPGWTVQDNVAHLVDYESRLLGRPAPDPIGTPATGDRPHVKNDMGKSNEIGVDARRARTGAEVLAEFAEVTSARIDALAEATDDELAAETLTPIGPGTVRDLLTLRVMDSWSHEQDIRRALGRPGHETGPAVDTSVAYFHRTIPYIVGKRAQAPDGTTVVLEVDGHPPVAVEVVDGRASPTSTAPEQPTVRIRTNARTFVALVCGRADADPAAVDIEGDTALGTRIVESLAFMP